MPQNKIISALNINVEKVFLVVIFLIAFAAFLFFAYTENQWAAGFCLPLVLILLLAIFPSDVTEMHFPGGKLKRVIREAEDTIQGLKQFAHVFGKSSLSLVARTMNDEDIQLETLNSLKGIFKNLGFSEEEIAEVEEDYHHIQKFEYFISLIGHHTVPNTDNREAQSEWSRMREKGMNNVPTPTEIRNFIQKYNFEYTDFEKRMALYEYYLKNNKHKDFAAYKDRYNWLEGGRLKKNA